MALHKENYGLIYNDDGSLCTTIRGDDVPFLGVTSFAVEEGTTNLLDTWLDGTMGSWAIYNPSSSDGTVEILSDDHFKYKIHIASNGTNRYGILISKTWSTTDTNVSISFYFKVNSYQSGCILNLYTDFRNSSNTPYYTYGVGVNLATMTLVKTYSNFTPETATLTPLSNGWYRLTFRHPELTSRGTLYIFLQYAPGDIYIAWPQLETKPFPTSFVDGTRPTGRLVIPVDLKFDIANDDWVISYWKYPVATNDGTQNGYNLCSLGQYTSDNSKGYIWWGKETYINKYRLFVILNDATYITNISANTFNPTDYFYHWHFEVMKKQGKVLSYYVDGVKQCELIIPADKEIQTPFDVGLSLGGYSGSHPNNALIANLLIARYDPNIWTDEYIRELYNARKPFAAPLRLPII